MNMIRFVDRANVGDVKEIEGGFLVATTRVARTGVQLYLARELGDIAINAGFAPDDVVRVYRHPDEVFHKDSLASITRVPVTVDHPSEGVTAENWAQLAVGEVGDAYTTDKEWIVVNPMIKDSAAIQAARTTHKEISMGYGAAIVKARDGLDADFEQKNIRYNHLALVPKGRAGDMARIGDAWGATPVTDFQPGNTPKTEKGGRMSDQLQTVVLGDKAVQVAVTDVAAIEQFKADTTKRITDAETAHAAAIAAKDEEIGKLRVDLAQAQKDAAIDVDALVAARTEFLGLLDAIAPGMETKGKADAELRKAAVAATLGDEMVVNASDAEIAGMFKAMSKGKISQNPVADAFKGGVKSSDNTALNDATAAYHARLTRQNKEG